jgi:acyl-CoA reductase-like NAD-dependent aldehyde dehydrogenase
MKHLKRFNEELKSSTYMRASKKLQKIVKDDPRLARSINAAERADKLKSHASDMEMRESMDKWKRKVDEYSKFGTFKFFIAFKKDKNGILMEDEIFGPLLPIIPYKKLEDAIQNILNYPKPLAFYVFSENSEKQKEIISRVPFGGGCINDTVVHLANPNLPFGGVGTSGIGSYHGQKSFDTFTHYKSVYKQGTLVDIPLRYPPYNETKLNWVKFFLR